MLTLKKFIVALLATLSLGLSSVSLVYADDDNLATTNNQDSGDAKGDAQSNQGGDAQVNQGGDDQKDL